jgi:hypothetical protein
MRETRRFLPQSTQRSAEGPQELALHIDHLLADLAKFARDVM